MPSSASSSPLSITSQYTVHPSSPADHPPLKLSASDLPMLSCHYIQKGVLLPLPPPAILSTLPSLLCLSLSSSLSLFPPLSSRLSSSRHLILSSSSGVPLVFASAPSISSLSLLDPLVPSSLLNHFFLFDRTVSYNGHSLPLIAVQVTSISDGVFVGVSANHAVVDGTSFWHFFNSFAHIAKTGSAEVNNLAVFSRDKSVLDTRAALQFPPGGPSVTFSQDEPLRERIFHFTREAILKLKELANKNYKNKKKPVNGARSTEVAIMGKQNHDNAKVINRTKTTTVLPEEVSSFQSLCAQVWRSVTRARNFSPSKTTTFRMAVNCRHRVEPKLDPYYFGNAIQSIATVSTVGELLSSELSSSAGLLHENVVKHGNDTVRRRVEEWEMDPKVFPLGNFDGASITMGSSPRFPMYDNDFGWGRPLGIRSGGANKFDGKISAFPGKEGKGSVDLEVVLNVDTMDRIERDHEFMQHVSVRAWSD